MPDWSVADIPPLGGRTAIVTGTGGLGFETARALAGAGARVVLAGRHDDRGSASVGRILAEHPAADISFGRLDLADLASVAGFARSFAEAHDRLDILVNNAGVMSPPRRRQTKDGFELQFGTNYLGHFALTGHLLPLLRRGPSARVVSVASLAHRTGQIRFDDLQGERRYGSWAAYCQSKLAMLVFGSELQRRSDAQGWGLVSNAAHPGYAVTNLIANGPNADGPTAFSLFSRALQPILSQSAEAGALPQIFAATSPDAEPAGYYGPDGFYELKGAVAPAMVSPRARDRAIGARLWSASQDLTGRPFPEA